MKKLFLLTLMGTVAYGDVYLGELKKGTCSRLKGQTYSTYVKTVLSDKKFEVTLDDSGTCGKSAYVLKREGRKRWVAFADETGCQCYLKISKVIEKAK